MIQTYTTDSGQTLCDVERNGEPMRAIGTNWPGELGEGAHVSTLIAIARERIGAIAATLSEDDPAHPSLRDAVDFLDAAISSMTDSGVAGG